MNREERQQLIDRICQRYNIKPYTDEEYKRAKEANNAYIIEEHKRVLDQLTKKP